MQEERATSGLVLVAGSGTGRTPVTWVEAVTNHMLDETHAFIVRVWYEETGGERLLATLRGSIEHVSDKKRIHFRHLEEILSFIEEQVGVDSLGDRPAQ